MSIFILRRGVAEKGERQDVLNIGIQNPGDSAIVWLFENVSTEGEFENIIRSIRENLEEIAEEGSKLLRKMRRETGGKDTIKPGMAAEEIWSILEQVEEEEIFSLFNNLPERDRKAVANYVFTSLNIFKGKPLYFSQHYDYASNLLVEG